MILIVNKITANIGTNIKKILNLSWFVFYATDLIVITIDPTIARSKIIEVKISHTE